MSDTMSLPTHEINLHNYSSTSKVAELQSIYLKKRGGRKKNENDERSKPKFQQSQPAIKMINSFSLPEIRHLGTKDWTKAYREIKYVIRRSRVNPLDIDQLQLLDI